MIFLLIFGRGHMYYICITSVLHLYILHLYVLHLCCPYLILVRLGKLVSCLIGLFVDRIFHASKSNLLDLLPLIHVNKLY